MEKAQEQKKEKKVNSNITIENSLKQDIEKFAEETHLDYQSVGRVSLVLGFKIFQTVFSSTTKDITLKTLLEEISATLEK